MDNFLINSFYDHARSVERDVGAIEDGWCIAIVWRGDDVQAIAEGNYDTTLTDDEVSYVLYMLRKHFDAEIGINWDVIDFWVSEVISEREDVFTDASS